MPLKTIIPAEFDAILDIPVELAKPEITEIVFPPISLIFDADYFLMSAPASTNYHIWFDVTGGGVDPNPGGSTAIKVDISGAGLYSSYDVAIAAQSAMDSVFGTVTYEGADRIKVVNTVAGVATTATDFNSGATIYVKQNGSSEEFRYIFEVADLGIATDDDHYAAIRVLGGNMNFKAADFHFLENFVLNDPDILSVLLIAEEDHYDTNIMGLANAQKIT